MHTFIFSILLSVTLSFTAQGVFAADLPGDASQVCPIKVGQTLPELSLTDINGNPVSLNKRVASQPTILIFYRGGWCPYCNTHLGELKTVEADLKKLGYQMLAISPDLPKNLKKSIDKNELTYELLSDSTISVARALGLAFEVDKITYLKYLGFGINLEEASGEEHHALPVPAAIVLDTDGKVVFTFVSPDYKVRINSKLLLAAAELSLQK